MQEVPQHRMQTRSEPLILSTTPEGVVWSRSEPVVLPTDPEEVMWNSLILAAVVEAVAILLTYGLFWA